MTASSIENLKIWFEQNKRVFPWRESPTPYAVWVSEVMLQQTRASVVVSYFNKWMKRFPTVTSLAAASAEDVLKMWEGLGYYSRARNLQKGAVEIELMGGQIPSSLGELLQISGIGPYTAGAILNFAFHQKALAIDGNVERVVSRYRGIEGNLKAGIAKKILEEEVLFLLPEEKPWVIMEGLIELGATFCLPTPKCEECPLKKNCVANLQGKTKEIPFKKKRKETIFLEKQVAVLFYGASVLIEKKEEGKLLGGLVEFPSFPYKPYENIEKEVLKFLGIESVFQEELPAQSQSFTRYRLELYPTILQVSQKIEVPGFFWKSLAELEQSLTFSSGHKRILRLITDLI